LIVPRVSPWEAATPIPSPPIFVPIPTVPVLVVALRVPVVSVVDSPCRDSYSRTSGIFRTVPLLGSLKSSLVRDFSIASWCFIEPCRS
jgi:hypothetical protein